MTRDNRRDEPTRPVPERPWPVFTSFEEAWAWFGEGGALVALEQKRDYWTRGRGQFLAFTVPVRDEPVVQYACALQDELADIEGIALVPEENLHISIRGVGFQVIEKRHNDEILRQDVPRIASKASPIAASMRQIEVTVGPPNIFPDAVVLEVHDDGSLAELRSRLGGLHGGVDAFGFDESVFLPHVTIATFERPDVAGALRERLPAVRQRPAVPTIVRRIELRRSWFTGLETTADVEADIVQVYLLKRA